MNNRYFQILLALAVILIISPCASAASGDVFSAWSSANGCWTATNDTYTLVMWNSTGVKSWKIPSGVTSINYLVVAGGGGGGGYRSAGGGGAGGAIIGSASGLSEQTVSISVGSGGAGTNSVSQRGNNGGNSTLGSPMTATAIGGGGGGAYSSTVDGATGGSGGGAAFMSGSGGAGTIGQGNSGGASTTVNADPYASGGGGGYTSAGSIGDTTHAGNGGVGYDAAQYGLGYVAAGGGGGTQTTAVANPGVGGSGIGGNGFVAPSTYPTNATPSTGSGGGGGGYTAAIGSVGGGYGSSGVVVFLYATPPVASFTKNVSEGVAPLSVQFNDTSTNTPTAWNYSYTNVTGNGTEIWFSQLQNPTFTFGVGNWSIRLNATYGGGSNTTPYNTSFVNVSPFMPYPILSFTSNTTSGYSPLAVQFNDTSETSITSWNWTFGGANYSSLQNPVYTFVGAGQYPVTLTVTNASRSNTSVFSNYITVTSAPIPIANFAGNVTTGYPGTVVGFTDLSTNSPTSWNWSFGDGSYNETQNPAHNYTSFGTYTVSLNATNSYGSNTNTKTNYITIVNASGFNQQDLTMAPQYTIAVTITDSSTNNVIPVVTVIDNNGNSFNTTNGTFIGTYPYSVIALTYFATGYTAKQVSYIMNRDQTQTVQLVPTTTTTNANTVWYVPKTVEFHTIDNYGNYLVGANVTARFNSSSNLPGGVSNLLTFYGMNQQAANDAANGTLIMTGLSDSMGNNVFTMLSTLNYDVYVTYGGVTNYFTIHPQSTNYELRFLGAVVPDYSLQTCVYANGHTYTSASSDYLGNFTMGFSYQDTCGKTTAIDYYVILQNTNTQVYTYHQAPVTSGIYTLNYTVPNVRGNNYAWFENYTRSV